MTSRLMSECEIRSLDKNLRILVETDGTLTKMLQVVYDEDIIVDIVKQRMRSVAPKRLTVSYKIAGPVLHRRVILSGRRSGAPFIAAESLIAVDLLPSTIVDVLIGTNLPIGETVAASGLEAHKRSATVWIDKLPRWVVLANRSDDELDVIRRNYCITLGGQSVIGIDEYFLCHEAGTRELRQNGK